MKNHWLPRFYLQRFLKDGEKLLCIYFRKTNSFQYKSPKVIATQKGYYTDKIENFFMRIENMAAPVLLKIDNKKRLNYEDKRIIAIFVSFLRTRVPFFEESMRKGFKELSRKYLDENFSSEAKAGEFIKNYEKKYGKKADMTVKELLEYVKGDPIELRLNRSKIFFNMMLRIGIKQVNLLLNMSWALLCCVKESSFITSDNPFITFNLKANHSKRILGVAGKNIVKLIPLSKKVCLFIRELTNKPVMTYFKMRSKKDVRLLNTYIVDNSNEILIAGQKEQLEKLVKMRIKS